MIIEAACNIYFFNSVTISCLRRVLTWKNNLYSLSRILKECHQCAPCIQALSRIVENHRQLQILLIHSLKAEKPYTRIQMFITSQILIYSKTPQFNIPQNIKTTFYIKIHNQHSEQKHSTAFIYTFSPQLSETHGREKPAALPCPSPYIPNNNHHLLQFKNYTINNNQLNQKIKLISVLNEKTRRLHEEHIHTYIYIYD